MSRGKFRKFKTHVPNYCPYFNTEKKKISRRLKEYGISYRDLSEALDRSLSESELTECIERKRPLVAPCVVMDIREAISDIIVSRWLGLK
jgi:hypothetical protein